MQNFTELLFPSIKLFKVGRFGMIFLVNLNMYKCCNLNPGAHQTSGLGHPEKLPNKLVVQLMYECNKDKKKNI